MVRIGLHQPLIIGDRGGVALELEENVSAISDSAQKIRLQLNRAREARQCRFAPSGGRLRSAPIATQFGRLRVELQRLADQLLRGFEFTSPVALRRGAAQSV